jgi:hypothetical protein
LIDAGSTLRRVLPMTEKEPERMARILGLAFDQEDGHLRITRGEDFDVYFGSEATHEEIREVCLKIQKKLDALGRSLQDLSREEFLALLEDLE